MLLIPLPLLTKSALEPIKKITLLALFSLGIFVMICAIMNKYYSFTEPFSPIWTFWYVRIDHSPSQLDSCTSDIGIITN